MNGSSSVAGTQTGRIKLEPDGDVWSKEDCLTLLERIRSLLPDGDTLKYKTTESHFDWDKVGFGNYTGDMCKQKWQKVSTEVRKYRTMTELIVDAIEYVKNPYKGKKLKTHPDFPKKPLTPYFRFFMEKRAKYAKIHPEMSNLDLTKILSKKYKELPEKKKLKYIQEFQREKESFEKNMARFKEDHPELIEERKKSDLPEKPKTPQQLWYNHEKKTFMKLHPEVSQKELKEALRRQWSQLSDKKRLKWISKALELQKNYEDSMRAYHEAHPDANSDEHVKSVLTKAERQLKDKFDGRPTKPPPNGYSLYCAELMVNMKDVPSTERMVLCSKQWKMMTQKEKDMFQKRCETKKKQYEVDLQRFLETLPEEERDRVLTEEKLGGTKLSIVGAGSPFVTKSPSGKDRGRDSELDQWVHGLPKEKRDGKKKVQLPETPKTAEEMWQQSVIGDYLAKYRNDRKKAQSAMEATWKGMEKKEKIPWIKKAAEDQKRYEVQYRTVRELVEMRTVPSGQGQRKPKFDGEPKKPPVSGYQMFSQELLTNGELNHFSLKERMVEIGKRWHKLSQGQKDKYKKQVEEQQLEYKAELDAWVKSLSPQERAVYKEFSSTKRRSTSKARGPGAKVRVTKGKAVGARAAALGAGGGKRSMAYRVKQDTSDSEEEDDKTNSTDSEDEDDESSASTDSEDEDDDEEDENDEDDDEDDEDQSDGSSSSSEDSSDSDSD
ncbi:upstream binding transcription factor, like isoform X1 [Pangasianodon hypophthalmus]|uniref:upstream binding transcription factor, like isoform X1 n=1 Tax=Pangasianodon hypophthalmus TaxID=310915 RepID=UPI0023072176|nr:upstream binding transcription factor, like isoform X1 [Pangasianodon hypophthalmus]XP_034159598.2 upstream binding transcription factor, like isoform X1 [Pangasianodon hypophthalmus]XP_034159600.2 upstream binding transcription factor, like isoform X1 [Pangasianodon hypophthalmus]XP_034159601.2 upstream binding transcription factor, like isoform X1 [Pangasianodon hypophthalmus]